MLINVLQERKGDKANIKTLDWLEERVEQALANNATDIQIDFSGVAINEKFITKLGELRSKYHVTLLGLGSKEEDVDAYVGTGYFLKEIMGVEGYTDWLVEKIEDADFPLMIMDNRVSSAGDRSMEIVQPLHFTDNRLYYKKLKPVYSEPYLLEEALRNGEEAWRMESIHRVDIASKEVGLRFASTLHERTILDIFEGILNKKYGGFKK